MLMEVEISSLDLRYESYRMKNPGTEKILLTSILENGIRDPLQGVDTPQGRILLNGFKRYRCAKKLAIEIVPYLSLGNDEAFGIIELIRLSNSKSLNILEQSKLIDELKTVHRMCPSDIARLLEKSKSWVSVRVGIIAEMSQSVMSKIMSGEFPVYSYMYTLRQFRRINCIKDEEIDNFVNSVAGKHLSIRDLDLLAHGYFKGGEEFRDQIKNGNVLWGLKRIKETASQSTDCTELERGMLRDLKVICQYMKRITCKCKDIRYKTNSFYAQANLLTGGIIKQMKSFGCALEEFHDRTRQT